MGDAEGAAPAGRRCPARRFRDRATRRPPRRKRARNRVTNPCRSQLPGVVHGRVRRARRRRPAPRPRERGPSTSACRASPGRAARLRGLDTICRQQRAFDLHERTPAGSEIPAAFIAFSTPAATQSTWARPPISSGAIRAFAMIRPQERPGAAPVDHAFLEDKEMRRKAAFRAAAHDEASPARCRERLSTPASPAHV